MARGGSLASERTGHIYGESAYMASTWHQKRRVIIEAKMVRLAGREPKDNLPFVVANLAISLKHFYENIYSVRGKIESRIKDFDGLEIGRTSCTRFAANQLHVFLAAMAYVLMQELGLRAQVGTIRKRLFKLGAWVENLMCRIVLHLPGQNVDVRE